jgi:hypothetical protein
MHYQWTDQGSAVGNFHEKVEFIITHSSSIIRYVPLDMNIPNLRALT